MGVPTGHDEAMLPIVALASALALLNSMCVFADRLLLNSHRKMIKVRLRLWRRILKRIRIPYLPRTIAYLTLTSIYGFASRKVRQAAILGLLIVLSTAYTLHIHQSCCWLF